MGDAGGDTPLHWAVCHNAVAATRALLAVGADASAANVDGGAAVHAAVINGSVEALAVLLLAGGAAPGVAFRWTARAGEDGGCRDTALHVAAAAGQRDAARLLLAAGAPLNAPNATGRTPLHEACRWRSAGVAEALLAAGADLAALDDTGRTPLGAAIPRSRVLAVVGAPAAGATTSASGPASSVAADSDPVVIGLVSCGEPPVALASYEAYAGGVCGGAAAVHPSSHRAAANPLHIPGVRPPTGHRELLAALAAPCAALEVVSVRGCSALTLPLHAAAVSAHPAARRRARDALSLAQAQALRDRTTRLLAQLASTAPAVASSLPALVPLPVRAAGAPLLPLCGGDAGDGATTADGAPALFARFWRDPAYADVVLCAAGGERLPAHRVVLASRCAALHALLSSPMQRRSRAAPSPRVPPAPPHADGEEVWLGMREEVLSPLLEWAYTGRVAHASLADGARRSADRAAAAAAEQNDGSPATLSHTPAAIAVALLEAADAYGLPALAEAAAALAVDFLTLEDAPLVWGWAVERAALPGGHAAGVACDLAAACADYIVSPPVARAMMAMAAAARGQVGGVAVPHARSSSSSSGSHFRSQSGDRRTAGAAATGAALPAPPAPSPRALLGVLSGFGPSPHASAAPSPAAVLSQGGPVVSACDATEGSASVGKEGRGEWAPGTAGSGGGGSALTTSASAAGGSGSGSAGSDGLVAQPAAASPAAAALLPFAPLIAWLLGSVGGGDVAPVDAARERWV